jgi:uncharacterized protein YndB with AHSA1/START domain
MLAVQRTRTVAASREELWDVLGDPHHLPRWWPRVNRVEAVTLKDPSEQLAGEGQLAGEVNAFTEVLMGSSGKIVRADFTLLTTERLSRIAWAQEVEGTPFARVLKSAETEITLAGTSELADVPNRDGATVAAGAPMTQVTIELRQELQGFRGESTLSLRMSGISRFGSPLVRRAAAATIVEALDGLERIVGR